MNLDWAWIQRNLSMIGSLLVEHIILSVLPVLIALVISLPLGFLVFKTKKVANVILAFLGVIYSIAFFSYWLQIDGLIGSKGIAPIAPLLDAVNEIVLEA